MESLDASATATSMISGLQNGARVSVPACTEPHHEQEAALHYCGLGLVGSCPLLYPPRSELLWLDGLGGCLDRSNLFPPSPCELKFVVTLADKQAVDQACRLLRELMRHRTAKCGPVNKRSSHSGRCHGRAAGRSLPASSAGRLLVPVPVRYGSSAGRHRQAGASPPRSAILFDVPEPHQPAWWAPCCGKANHGQGPVMAILYGS